MKDLGTSAVSSSNETPISVVNALFKYNDQSIRVIGAPEEPWFCGKDVASVLGYYDTEQAIAKHIRIKNIKTLSEFKPVVLTGLKANEKSTKYINEKGLYELIMKSKLPGVEAFQDWVYDTIKTIRETGGYISPTASNAQITELQAKLTEQQSQIAKMQSDQSQLQLEYDSVQVKIAEEIRLKQIAFEEKTELLSYKKRLEKNESVYSRRVGGLWPSSFLHDTTLTKGCSK